MQEVKITQNEAGQRLDKFLLKYFKAASPGFIYKMLRKKNIVLNGKKSAGKEKLSAGDSVKIFMTDETISKFRGESAMTPLKSTALDIVYEDDNVLIVNKPSGMLSQKADKIDISLNEYIISYLVETGKITEEQLKTFRPSICNRLDRNTSGLIVAGKSLKGLQVMSEMFKERTMDKYYITVVRGKIHEKIKIKGFLTKNENTNKVIILQKPKTDSRYIETEYEPLACGSNITVLKVKLITGRTHQIRAHLASVGHPIIGDYKYGDKKVNTFYKDKYKIKNQMLHSWKLVFPKMQEGFEKLSNREISAKLPEEFKTLFHSKNIKVKI